MLHRMKTTISMHTIVAPTGVEARIDNRIPTEEQNTEITADATMTARKLFSILMAERAGKMISADMSSEPTSFMASTITDAVTIAIRRL